MKHFSVLHFEAFFPHCLRHFLTNLDENRLVEMMQPDQFLLISWTKYRVTQDHSPWCWLCLLPQLQGLTVWRLDRCCGHRLMPLKTWGKFHTPPSKSHSPPSFSCHSLEQTFPRKHSSLPLPCHTDKNDSACQLPGAVVFEQPEVWHLHPT